MKKLTVVLALLAAFSFAAKAQDFTPYPYIQLQGGASYDFGDASFTELLSPAAQIAVGYQFVDCWSVRFAVNGWQAKHTSWQTESLYGYNFIQPNLDLILDWSAGFFGWRPDRPVSVYTLFGAGAGIGLENQKAADLAASGEFFEHLWHPVKPFWNLRSGLGTDIRLSDRVALNLEFDAQYYPDSFNSRENRKVGSSPDYHFVLLGGLKFNLGWRPKKVAPAPPVSTYQPTPTPRQEPKKEEPKKEYKEEPASRPVQPVVIEQGADVDIFFDLNKSVIREDQVPTLNQLVNFMRNNPDAKVKLDGYADKQTGTADINQALSEDRVIAVRQYLVSRGIEAARITTAAHGDKVQPFTGEKNRAVTCRIR
ncbi:MAG: OmpA family protein [Bacteroidales bacterium]|nr:OmpA family protein [Bacteroidales bacterium]